MIGLERGPTLTDQAAEHIRARIVRGALQLGEAVSENTLAAELKVSKTPVREALMRLKGEGLVEVHPKRGTFVFAMTAEQVRKLSELRAILEAAAGCLALADGGAALAREWEGIVEAMRRALERDDAERYRKLDGEFHRALFDLADNDYLADAFNTIAFRVQALRNRLSLDPTLNHTSFAEHEALLGLARRGDATAIGPLLERHIAWTREHYLAVLGAPPDAADGAPRRVRRRLSPASPA